ncbi:MAG: DUF3427 domain-containing protein [Sphaerochaeta sp.]|nr:DUF3427 domain-containing protein [Sphaerochaeta sp.]
MDSLERSLQTAFVDHTIASPSHLRPQLVVNNPPKSKVVEALVAELERCTSFSFSVAFLTTGGIASILQALYNAHDRGVTGKILTSDYLTFTDPRALRFLYEHFSSSIEVRISSHVAFHAKGYRFERRGGETTLLIGSSNLTQAALSTNEEWNLRVVSEREGELSRRSALEFERAWSHAVTLDEGWLQHYSLIWETVHHSQHYEPLPISELPLPRMRKQERIGFQPNAMQAEALDNLVELRASGKDRALVVSATGTGKTLLAVADVERQRPRRLLFIIHREQIAQEARSVFTQNLSQQVDSAILGGGRRETTAPYLFATIATLAKDEVLYSFPPTWFDYVIIDEVHRGGAPSYQKVLDHLRPDFLLGMTATPYRSDGQDIFALFDYSLACEITLNQALAANLLVPFHYYGITGLEVGESRCEHVRDFVRLERSERSRRIVQMIRRYSLGNPRPRGLIFCSRNREARELAEDLNALGLKAVALSGKDSLEVREAAFASLEAEEGYEYLISVNILNEGVDIPSLNQIIMIRPTESAIVFVQQLGRGLRKFDGKEYLTVIDFIGNWKNNYLIPIALFGDASYRKDTLRKLMRSGSAAISGPSTISFDPIARQRIFAAIDSASFTRRRLLKEEYDIVKRRLGRVPKMVDFLALGAMSPLLFLAYAKTYLSFRQLVDRVEAPDLEETYLKSLAFFAKVVARGIRIQEIHIIEMVMGHPEGLGMEVLKRSLYERYGFVPTDRSLQSALRLLDDGFFKDGMRAAFGKISYIETDGAVVYPSALFRELLEHPIYYTELVDTLEVGRYHYLLEFHGRQGDHDLVLYQKYSRRDVVRLLGWENDDSSTVYGYRVNYELKQCPIFVTYHKDSERISALTDYRDRFLSPDTFIWESKHTRTTRSKEVAAIREEGVEKLLFVKKSDDEGGEFYYLGPLHFMRNAMSTKTDEQGRKKPVVMVRFSLFHAVPDDLYHYLIEEPEVLGQATEPA